jgi:hypothetical protein
MILLTTIASVISASGQEVAREQQQYLFPEFQDARVVLKNGTSGNTKLNYSLVTNRFVFIDAADNNLIKEFSNPSQIGTITIGNRTFQPAPGGEAIEIVQFERPAIFVQYTGKSTDRGTKSAYGGRSNTSSIQSLDRIAGSGAIYRLEGDDRFIITGVDKIYQIGVGNNRMKSFVTLKQLQKIFPKKLTPAIEEYAVEKSIDFNSVEQVVDLCNYAVSLN